MIRDAETEAYLKDLASPIYQAAGLSPSQVRLFIVQDDRINAFVAGGANMFIHTGLMVETQTPEMLLGVIAHETGHIAGGHLLRGGALAERAQIGAILTYLLGAAAIASGGGDAGAAIISAGTHGTNRSFLAYSRTNEQAADQAALEYLDSAGISARGMVMMFERLRREEKRHIGANADAYARTHPLSQRRINHIESHLRDSPLKNNHLPQKMQDKHARIRGKLIGFLDTDRNVFIRYPKQDTSEEARIARAIAYSAYSQRDKALAELVELEKTLPNDPYIYELRGHILFENGQLALAAEAYKKSVSLAPNAALIRSDYAKTLLAQNDKELVALALDELLVSSKSDPTYHQTWRLLSRAYGAMGDIGMAELALAELSALNNNREDILLHVARAQQHLNSYSEASLRIDDLRAFARTLKDDKEESIF